VWVGHLLGCDVFQGFLTTLCCDSLEEVLCCFLVWAFEGFDEDYAVVWLRFLRVKALYSYGHLGPMFDLLK
jgi:hypothetical protein